MPTKVPTGPIKGDLGPAATDMREGGPPRAAAAAAATAALRPGSKLQPNPITTLCRPAQLLASKRQAEQAAAEQDVMALQQLLASGPEERQHGDGAPRAPAQLEGCLSSLTLQALLPSAPPSQANLQRHASLPWQARSSTWHDTGQHAPDSLAGEPSALTAYIAQLEEDSSVAERQLAHLQASSSGARGVAKGALPSLLRCTRKPLAPTRREVLALSKWLEVGGTWPMCLPMNIEAVLTGQGGAAATALTLPCRCACRRRRGASTLRTPTGTRPPRCPTSCCWLQRRRGACTAGPTLSWRGRYGGRGAGSERPGTWVGSVSAVLAGPNGARSGASQAQPWPCPWPCSRLRCRSHGTARSAGA